VKLKNHLHIVPRSKNEWSYTSAPPWRGAHLKKYRTALPLPLWCRDRNESVWAEVKFA